ncbi:hypothetical protein BaOVIS_005290 [Babesia ovis]|uniref:Uncharacterized protein n=1 Tax=Babesia ovis TaxID=5869 RepID=A0A9W5T8A2_BABOV|nr:hypothetical protein BaOVIS_005290 [Babesia ovis]
MASQIHPCSGDMGCNTLKVDPIAKERQNHAETRRYKIIPYHRHRPDEEASTSFDHIKLLELGGDLPQLFNDQRWDTASTDIVGGSSRKSDAKQNRKTQLPMAINTMNIESCFDINHGAAISRTTSTDSHSDVSFAWGTLRTSLPIFHSNYDMSSARLDGHITMTIGTNVLNGKHNDMDYGDYILVLRKVQSHCSCSCSTDNHVEPQCDKLHNAHFEICAITKSRITFNERPCIMHHSNGTDGDISWFLCQCEHMESINPGWLLLRMGHKIVDIFKSGNAHFKVVKNIRDGETMRLILSLNDDTYYIERVELGGKMLLVNPIKIETQSREMCNVLSIVGCCKFIHNLVSVEPNFAALQIAEDLPLQNILDSLPIADAQIKLYLMNAYKEWPCDYLYLKGGLFSRVDPIIIGEFTIAVLRLLDIHCNEYKKHHNIIEDLEVQSVWSMVQTFPQEFGFLAEKLQTPAVIFQLLRLICDVQESLSGLEDYLLKLENGEFHNMKLRLNLFKIHRQIVWAICVANGHKRITYAELVKKVDSLLFTDRLPSYIFDGMIRYLIKDVVPSDADLADYIKCLLFYYEKASFSDVADKMSQQFRRKREPALDKPQYSITVKQLFIIGDCDRVMVDESKTACFNYSIFKLNTRGLTMVRFKYAMNSILMLCKCPMSLHVAFIADRVVAIEENNTCLIQLYPKERMDTLRDVLSSLFRLNNTWHLEDIEKKLVRFLGNRQPLESITGGPNFHARLWVTNERNALNYYDSKRDTTEGTPDKTMVDSLHNELRHMTEESYIIINSNVPV